MNRFHKPLVILAAATGLLCFAAFYVASSHPDGLERVAGRLGFAARANAAVNGPFADYQGPFLRSPAGRNMVAGLIGAGTCFLVAFGIGKYAARRAKRAEPGSARPLE